MLDNVNATIIDATVKSYMSDESVTIDSAISDANDLMAIKTTVMLNILEEAKKIDKYRKQNPPPVPAHRRSAPAPRP